MSRTILAIGLALIVLCATTQLTLAQRDQTQEIAFDITGLFEGGKPDSLQIVDAGIISYGIHQATLASGSLYDVISRYTQLSQTPISEQMVTYLSRVRELDSSLRSDAAFLKLLKDAASESAMIQAQNEIFSQNYYEPAKQKAAADGVTSALGIAIYYDTNIQGGLETVRKATSQHLSQGTLTEQEWLDIFLDERRNYLIAVAESKRKNGLDNDAKFLENSASTQGRVGILQDIVEAGNLDLKHGDANEQISIGKFGSVPAIDSAYRAELSETGFGTTDSESTGFGMTDSESSDSEITQKQQTLGERVVELARSVEGAGYANKKGEYSNYELMDSETVKKEGIDCSGLVFWAFNKAADVSTWRPSLDPSNDVCPECVVDRYGADGQWNDEKMWEVHNEFTTPPSENELKPGDLLYVNTADRGKVVDHVGIYAGNGKVIHSTSGGVTEISYNEWKQKYASYFFGYGRVKGTDDTSFGTADTNFGPPSSSSPSPVAAEMVKIATPDSSAKFGDTSSTDTGQDTKGTIQTTPVVSEVVKIGAPDSSAKFGDTSSSDTGQDTKGTIQTTPVVSEVVKIGTPDSSAKFGDTSSSDTGQDTEETTQTTPVVVDAVTIGTPDSSVKFGDTGSSDTGQDTKETTQTTPVVVDAVTIGTPDSSAILEDTTDHASTQEVAPLAKKTDTQEASSVVADVLSLGFLQGLQPIAEAASQSTGESSLSVGSASEESDLGGINFTSIKLNSIAIDSDQESGVNFDLILKAQKAGGTSPVIDPFNATRLGATAFMTGLAIADNKFWVNLAPWEPDRIIDEELAQSDVGRVMLEADLQMKRDFSNYGNPCVNDTGNAMWDLLDKKRAALVQRCMERFPGELKDIDNVNFRPVTRHWIVPDKVYAYVNGTQIYIINSSLSINSEPVANYSTYEVTNQDLDTLSNGCREELNRSAKEFGAYNKELDDQMIFPYVLADVNYGEKYEDLREVYIALALAQWYKSSVTSRRDIFRDSTVLLNSSISKSIEPWSPQEIWVELNYSFKNGEYKCWKNETIETATGNRNRSSLRSAGGVDFGSIKDNLISLDEMPQEVQNRVKNSIAKGFINEEKDVFYGKRFNVVFGQSTNTNTGHYIDRNLAATWHNKGFVLHDQGKLDEAIEAYDEAIRWDPNLAEAWYNKGSVLNDQGKYDEAIEAYDEATRITTEIND